MIRENRETVVAACGVEAVLPIGAAMLSEYEITELSDALDDLDLQGIVRQWIDDHAPRPAAKVILRDLSNF